MTANLIATDHTGAEWGILPAVKTTINPLVPLSGVPGRTVGIRVDLSSDASPQSTPLGSSRHPIGNLMQSSIIRHITSSEFNSISRYRRPTEEESALLSLEVGEGVVLSHRNERCGKIVEGTSCRLVGIVFRLNRKYGRQWKTKHTSDGDVAVVKIQ